MMAIAASRPVVVPKAQEYERIRRWVYERTGIFFADHKLRNLNERLLRVCSKAHLGSIGELAERLESDLYPELQSVVMDAVTTNHTYFFREPQVLEAFRRRVIPTLPAQGKWRIWSAASSSGDEAYTIAMIVAQTRGRDWLRQNLQVLGTDVSGPAILQAEKAVYDATRLEHTSAACIQSFFTPDGNGRYQVAEDLRRVCLFRRLNLKAWPYPFQRRFHVVFCRNVLYYFDKPQQREILLNLYQTTEPGGWLLTSVTESLRDLDSPWLYVASGVYRKEPA